MSAVHRDAIGGSGPR